MNEPMYFVGLKKPPRNFPLKPTQFKTRKKYLQRLDDADTSALNSGQPKRSQIKSCQSSQKIINNTDARLFYIIFDKN